MLSKKSQTESQGRRRCRPHSSGGSPRRRRNSQGPGVCQTAGNDDNHSGDSAVNFDAYHAVMQIFTDKPTKHTPLRKLSGPSEVRVDGLREPQCTDGETYPSSFEDPNLNPQGALVNGENYSSLSRASISDFSHDGKLMHRTTNKFLDLNVEAQYQDTCTHDAYYRARWLVGMTIIMHVVLYLAFSVRGQKLDGLNLWPRDFSRVDEYAQCLYLVLAVPFVLISTPRGFRCPCLRLRVPWKTWACCTLLLLMVGIQIWLSYQATLSVRQFAERSKFFVSPKNECSAPLSDPFFQGLTFGAFVRARDDVIYMSFIAHINTLISLIGGSLGLTMQLDFPHVSVLISLSCVASWIIIISYSFSLPPPHSLDYVDGRSWLAFIFTNALSVILIATASYYTDRTKRRTFLVIHYFDEKNEELKDNLERAEAALTHFEETPEERRAVKAVMEDRETAQILEEVKIPFSHLKLEKKIYTGTITEVILATYRGSKVAVKRILRDKIHEQVISVFKAEIELMACLRHPNIVQFIGASWDNYSNICMVVEYLERRDVQSLLACNLILTWSDPLLKMAIDAAQGMLYLHASDPPVVHRDLKSRNLLCSATFGCKVSDFARSRKFYEDDLTTFAGTPFWLAPEVIRGEPYNEKADCYSFGVVLTEFETRKLPYQGYGKNGLKIMMAVAHQGLRPTIPDTCQPVRRQLMLDCMKEDPESRPSMREILDRLQGEVRRELAGREVREMNSTSVRLHLKRKAMFTRQDRLDQLQVGTDASTLGSSLLNQTPSFSPLAEGTTSAATSSSRVGSLARSVSLPTRSSPALRKQSSP